MNCAKLLVIAFIYIEICTGCATSWTFVAGRQIGPFSLKEGCYPATRLDAEALGGLPAAWCEDSKAELMLEIPFVLIDFPFSIVFDTLLLPYDLLQSRR